MPATPNMPRIANWSARRSGAFQTVTGIDANHGGEVKISQVVEIAAGDEGRVLATDKGGDRYYLLANRQPLA